MVAPLDILLKRLQKDKEEINSLIKNILELQDRVGTIPQETWYNIISKITSKRLYKRLERYSKKLDKLVEEQNFLLRELEIKKILDKGESTNGTI